MNRRTFLCGVTFGTPGGVRDDAFRQGLREFGYADGQYLRNDAVEALGTFRKRREETLAHLRTLSAEQWQRGGIHPRRGRMTVGDFVTDMAWHDDNNHLDQLRRALDGKV
jgi:hypothetical protein